MYRNEIYVTAARANVQHQTPAEVIKIKRFETGFYPTAATPDMIAALNGRTVDDEVIESAVSASIFGWDVPISEAAHDWFAADPRPVDPRPREPVDSTRYYLVKLDGGGPSVEEFKSERERMVRCIDEDDTFDDFLCIDVDKRGKIDVTTAMVGADARDALDDMEV